MDSGYRAQRASGAGLRRPPPRAARAAATAGALRQGANTRRGRHSGGQGCAGNRTGARSARRSLDCLCSAGSARSARRGARATPGAPFGRHHSRCDGGRGLRNCARDCEGGRSRSSLRLGVHGRAGARVASDILRLIAAVRPPMVDSLVKERLTGAIILVGLIVLLVPEVLTGPVRSAPAPQGAAPAAGEPPLRSYTIDLADESHTRATTAPADGSPTPQASGPAQPLPITAPASTRPPQEVEHHAASEQQPTNKTLAFAG